MPDIIITKEVNDRLRAAAVYHFEQTGYELETGEWVVPLSEDTFEQLSMQQLEGETISDTLLRLFSPKN